MTRRLTRTGVIHILPTTCSLTDTAKTVRTNLRVLFSSPNLSYLALFLAGILRLVYIIHINAAINVKKYRNIVFLKVQLCRIFYIN
jgi:hypothetical protein